VRNAATGAPVPNARIEVVSIVGQTLAGTLSDPQGRYRILNMAPGTYELVARMYGYDPQRVSDVSITAGSVATVTFELTERPIELDAVQVSGSRRTEKATQAPARVSVVGSEQIEDMPALTIIDHVRTVPGVDISRSGLVQQNVVTRGFNNVFSTALMMITDHRHASVPSLRINAPYMIPASDDDIEQIEVVVGPAAALYGPNSANGVLHAITKSPFTSGGTSVSLAGGERSLLQGGFRHAGVAAEERVGYRISGQYLRGDDWEFADPAEPVGTRDSRLEIMKADGRVDLRLRGNTNLILSGGLSQVGNAVEMTPLGAAQVDDWRYVYLQTRFNRSRFFAQAFVNTSDAGETFLLRTGQPIVDRSRQFVAQVQHGSEFGQAPGRPDRPLQSFIYGLDLQHTQPRTEGTILGRHEGVDLTEMGGYLQSQTRLIPRVDLVLAGRLDHHSHFGDPMVSPRAAVVYEPVDGQNFRVTYNRAFDNPIPNNLFLDILAGQIGGFYNVRAISVPRGGFGFNRDCPTGQGQFCMRSPFTPAPGWIPADATLMWDVAVAALLQQGVDLRQIPRPESPSVGTVLRVLDPTALVFRDVVVSELTDLPELRPTITNAFEVGYKGLLADRVLLGADLWYNRKRDFTGPLMVETPNVFFDHATLAQHLARFMPAQQAQQVAAAIGGLPGNPEVTGIPLGQVTFDHEFVGAQDLVLTFRNFGEVDLWGTDLSAEVLLSSRVAVNGSYSFVSSDFFTPEEVGGPSPVALNAPQNKGTFGVQYRNIPVGLTGMVRGRWVAGFPMNSGVYVGDVPSYRVVDATVAYRVPQVPGLQVAVSAQNLLNERHRQWVGAPELGRLVMSRLQYAF
jgi:outer membrane receptor for ferrienterochelin and colicins